MNFLKTLISGILAGLCIGFGGMVFLSVDNKVIGSLLFSIGLFVVCTQKFDLFTGKVCYTFANDGKYALRLPVIWLGNLIGTGCAAGAAWLTRASSALSEKAAALCAVKTGDSLVSLFFLGVLCNIFIYIGVEGYINNPHEVGKYMAIVLGVMVFILCGTEHCVADMFYFWMGGAWSGQAVVSLLVITLGNACGGVLLPLLKKAAGK